MNSLMSWQHVEDEVPRDTYVIVPATMNRNQRQALDALQIPAERILAYTAEECWKLENLYFSPDVNRKGHASRTACAWFRERVYSTYGIRPGQGARRLYVSRQATLHGRVANEDEVEQVLHQYGFETVTGHELSFEEQVSLFAQAEIIAGAHGAGLTNMIFAPKDACVLEFSAAGVGLIHFWSLASALQLGYWYLAAEPVSTVNGPRPDIRIRVTELRATLDAILTPS
jgi:capsular polysaccharide biosynthesis protein